MPRPRLPMNIINLKGADKVNPGRFKERQNEMQPETIGRVPAHFLPEYKGIWEEIVNALPEGTIKRTDRVALEMLCKLIHEMRTDFENMQTAQLTRLETLLGKFGMTPADRSKIIVPEQKKHNPFDDF